MRGRRRVLPQPGLRGHCVARSNGFFFYSFFPDYNNFAPALMRAKKQQNNNRPRIGQLTAANDHNNNNDRIMSARVLFGSGGRYQRNTVVTNTRRCRVSSKWPDKNKSVFSPSKDVARKFLLGLLILGLWSWSNDIFYLFSRFHIIPNWYILFCFCPSRRPTTTYLARPVALFRV